ncbi:MAG: hypothetical protein O7D86_04185 [Proteobacteria bacterium]|nr:hypothetical protein [Pseudomonadota bacterium]
MRGLVPLSTVSMDGIELIPIWLNSQYDRGLVATDLSKGILRHALASNTTQSLELACRILYHCTAIHWVSEDLKEDDRTKPVTVVEDHWLKDLLTKHVPAFGGKTGQAASAIFVERLREIFDPERTRGTSYWSRPAIEEHEQNHSWEGPENRLVEGLRDILLHWIDHDLQPAHDFVLALLSDDTEIIRRIAIHTLNHRWQVLNDIDLIVVSAELFHSDHLHELYELLSAHFMEMSDDQKSATLESIRHLPTPIDGEDQEKWLKRDQRNWLSSIVDREYAPADEWHTELNSYPDIGRLPPHPSFHSYMESWSGPGPSKYTVQQLLGFAKNGNLIDMLNEFEEVDSWRGPTTRVLVDELTEAVKNHPQVFLRIMSEFVIAKRPYQYGLINGFKQLWDSAKDGTTTISNWDEAWEKLIRFFEQVINADQYWQEIAITDHNLTPNRDWIAPVIVELLRAGTREYSHSYPEALLSRAWQLINTLLEKIHPEIDADEDAMHHAINSAKGKTIEALFSHALRTCRVSDKASNQHTDVWESMRPTFESELNKCKDSNFEFSTLAGSYSVNLEYMNQEWLQANFEHIFSAQYPVNCTCALNGLAYAPVSGSVYGLLVDTGVLDRSLRMELKGRHTRENLIQRIAVAYLWQEETLDGPRFDYFFEANRLDDLEDASDFFWSVSNQDLDQVQINQILTFWDHSITWSQTLDEPPVKLLSSLGKLSCYLETIDDNTLNLLLTVAPYVHVGHDADRFIEELDRLADTYPGEVSPVLGEVLKTYKPHFDYQDRLKSLIRKIANHGVDEKIAAIAYVDKLIALRISGMRELLEELSENN